MSSKRGLLNRVRTKLKAATGFVSSYKKAHRYRYGEGVSGIRKNEYNYNPYTRQFNLIEASSDEDPELHPRDIPAVANFPYSAPPFVAPDHPPYIIDDISPDFAAMFYTPLVAPKHDFIRQINKAKTPGNDDSSPIRRKSRKSKELLSETDEEFVQVQGKVRSGPLGSQDQNTSYKLTFSEQNFKVSTVHSITKPEVSLVRQEPYAYYVEPEIKDIHYIKRRVDKPGMVNGVTKSGVVEVTKPGVNVNPEVKNLKLEFNYSNTGVKDVNQLVNNVNPGANSIIAGVDEVNWEVISDQPGANFDNREVKDLKREFNYVNPEVQNVKREFNYVNPGVEDVNQVANNVNSETSSSVNSGLNEVNREIVSIQPGVQYDNREVKDVKREFNYVNPDIISNGDRKVSKVRSGANDVERDVFDDKPEVNDVRTGVKVKDVKKVNPGVNSVKPDVIIETVGSVQPPRYTPLHATISEPIDYYATNKISIEEMTEPEPQLPVTLPGPVEIERPVEEPEKKSKKSTRTWSLYELLHATEPEATNLIRTCSDPHISAPNSGTCPVNFQARNNK